ncbi:MAG: alpha/beta fold hydrolase [Wenzhouxiangellaceae bacterium]|nr:alpha/beta fold hydrolase [Wenzhouxiangellaceae bacterium]
MAHDEPAIMVEAGDGHRFELIDIAPDAPDRMMLLLPGLGISARNYIPFARALAARGTRTMIHEWRGTGASNRRATDGDEWGYRELLELDIDASLRAVLERGNGDRTWLAGHSLGGQLACLAAARRTAASRGLVLIAAGAPYAAAYSWPMRPVLRFALRAFPWLASRLGHFPGRRIGFAGNESAGVMRDWARTGRTGRYDLDSLGFDPETALQQLTCNVLAVRMADDRFAPPASLEWLLDKLPGCDVDRELVDARAQGVRADHFGWLKRPGACAETVADWLEATAGY